MIMIVRIVDIIQKFINLVLAKNVFVNTSVQNEQINEKYDEGIYVYKNVILPIPKQEDIIKDVDLNLEEINDENLFNKSDDKENMKLAVINENVLEKIKKFLRRIFFKNS